MSSATTCRRARYSRSSPRGAIYVWDPKHGLVLHGEVVYLPLEDCRVIHVFPMPMCEQYGYTQASLIFAAQIGAQLYETHVNGAGLMSCASNLDKCHRYRRLAKEPTP